MLIFQVVILCGSILEAVLLGKAQQEPAQFNSSNAAPKNPQGKVKQFQDWTLKDFIDVASALSVLKPDVKKFSTWIERFSKLHPSLSADGFRIHARQTHRKGVLSSAESGTRQCSW